MSKLRFDFGNKVFAFVNNVNYAAEGRLQTRFETTKTKTNESSKSNIMFIANYIRNDLAARLRSGTQLPVQLTLGALAEMYEVSHTPIRTAVAELIDQGLLEKGPNRRLVAIAPRDSDRNKSRLVELPQLPIDPYETIVCDLIQLSLKGDSIYLREEITAEKYNVSRPVIRNIFHRLVGEGILDHIPRRGWRLRTFRQSDLKAFVEVRESLELKALALAFPNLDSDEIERMLQSNSLPQTPDELPRIDESLHTYLIKLSGNAYIKDFFTRQGRYYELLFDWEDRDRDTAIETVRQHREILTSLLNRDEQAARELLSYHILNNHPILSQIARDGVDGEDRSTMKPRPELQ